MADTETGLKEGDIVGVRIDTHGNRDYSRALHVISTEKSKISPLQEILAEAGSFGINQQEIVMILQSLRDKLQPLKKSVLAEKAKKYNVSESKILDLIRRYRKESIRENEKGELLHYHQTSKESFAEATADRQLKSYDTLKAEGKTPKSSGTRPDVVQMTRDIYNKEGKLKKRGLAPDTGAAGSDIALVFKPTIIDDPEYDAIDNFPNLPRISFANLQAVIIGDYQDKPDVENILIKNNLPVEIKTKKEWQEEEYKE